MPVAGPGRLEELAAALERACAAAGVLWRRTAIPYGVKFDLAQGMARGVVSVYTTGKVVANRDAARHFADLVGVLGEPVGEVARARRAGHAPVTFPYLGSDESGKGDYFGPLAVAAVLVRDEREDELLRELGTRDSKLITSTGAARKLAQAIREVCRGRFREVVVHPERYNQLVAELKAQGRTSNALLAWAHVAAYEPLLGQGATLAVADKFGNEGYIRSEMRRRGHEVALRQETGGERYTAVAAASILARSCCLEWFERAEVEVGERLPRGAFDPAIIDVARRIHGRGGEALLGRFAKLHFRTTARVLA